MNIFIGKYAKASEAFEKALKDTANGKPMTSHDAAWKYEIKDDEPITPYACEIHDNCMVATKFLIGKVENSYGTWIEACSEDQAWKEFGND